MFAWLPVVYIGNSSLKKRAVRTFDRGTGRSKFMMVAGIFKQLCKLERILKLGPEICFPQASVTTQIRHPGKLEDPTGVEEFFYDSVNA